MWNRTILSKLATVLIQYQSKTQFLYILINDSKFYTKTQRTQKSEDNLEEHKMLTLQVIKAYYKSIVIMTVVWVQDKKYRPVD